MMAEPLGRVAVVVPCNVSVPDKPEARREDSSAALRLDWRADAAAALPVGVAVAVLARAEALNAESEAARAEEADAADAADAAALEEARAAAMEKGKVVCTAVKVARREVVPVRG